MTMMVRIGIPASFRRFSAVAVEMEAPMLVSANALRRRGRGFSRPRLDMFSGGDVALDSAGFVAMVRYKGYPWTVADYVELAAAYPWAWWAQMDFCCEPQVASDRAEVRRRQDLTAEHLRLCREAASMRGIVAPMPVIQGWQPDDYRRSVDLLSEMAPLLGVGSVCRRPIDGKTGLIQVIKAIDGALPRGVRLHLFGVKGTAIEHLTGHPRIASVDSMAWDYAARREKKDASCSLPYRIGHMRRWYSNQRRPRRDNLFTRIAMDGAAGNNRAEWWPVLARPAA